MLVIKVFFIFSRFSHFIFIIYVVNRNGVLYFVQSADKKKFFFVPQIAVAIFFSVSTMAAFAHLIYSINFVVKIVVEFYLLSDNDSKLFNFF